MGWSSSSKRTLVHHPLRHCATFTLSRLPPSLPHHLQIPLYVDGDGQLTKDEFISYVKGVETQVDDAAERRAKGQVTQADMDIMKVYVDSVG